MLECSSARRTRRGATGLNTGHRVARNTLLSGVSEGSNLLLFLLCSLAARLLGPTPFGQYSTAFAFVGLFRILPDFGMSYASALEISRERSLAQRLIGGVVGFQAVLSILTLVLCLGIGRGLIPLPGLKVRYEGVTWIAVLVLAFDLVLKSVKSTLRWLLKSFEKFGTEALSLLLERTLLLVLGSASLLAGWGVAGFVSVFLVVRLLDTSGLYAYLHVRVLPLAPRCDVGLWWELLRKGLPFAFAGAMITLSFQVDTVMLEWMRGPKEVGWYRAPVFVLEGLTLVPRVLGYALMPAMAAFHVSAPEKVAELYRRGSKYLLLAGLPIAAFGALASGPFIAFLFGPDYGPSAAASRILLPAATFMFLSNFGETTLACINRWGTIVLVSTVALVLNVLLNLLWIPAHGYLGAAWATLATESSYFAMTAIALFAFGYRVAWAPLLGRPALAASAFTAALWLLRRWPLIAASRWPLLAASAGACVIFAAATILAGVWDEKERELLRRLLRGAAPDPGRLAI